MNQVFKTRMLNVHAQNFIQNMKLIDLIVFVSDDMIIIDRMLFYQSHTHEKNVNFG